MADPLRVLVTGAAGQIAYSLLYPVAKGDVFGKEQPISLVLLDIPSMMGALDGVVMELQDCSLTLLTDVVATADEKVAFSDVDIAILVGAMPRRDGMERKDLLKANAKIFESQGKALSKHAKKSVKVLVVGNPANTNCLITATCAPDIPSSNFTCLTRLDFNRALGQISLRLKVRPDDVKNVIIWGNHSSTQYPDARHATVNMPNEGVMPVPQALMSDAWLKGDFIKTIQQRGASVIKARKLSSAMSAAKAICDHMRDWWFGTKPGEWTCMGVMSDGSYDIPTGIIYSFPVEINSDGQYKIVQGLSIDDFSRERMDATAKELIEEKDSAMLFLSQPK